MEKGVNIYDLLHGFWKENEYEPFPTSAIALFFFLVDRANSRHWKMPVSCPTTFISHLLSMSRQTVITSRDVLWKRGLIMVSKGDVKGTVPLYTIVMDPKMWTPHLSMEQTADLTGNLTANSTVDSTADLTTYKKKDKKTKDKISSLYNVEPEKILNLDVLEELFLSDSAWQADLISLLPKDSATEINLKEQISLFFRQLKCQGIDKREEKDCRTHFVNWINKRLKQNGISQQQLPADRRRGSDVTATSARDYDGAF